MKEDIERYLALRASLGYGDACLARILRRYGRHAEAHGWNFVARKNVDEYFRSVVPSPRKRRDVFHMIRRFSDWMRAEDDRYQELEARFHGIGKERYKLIPYLYDQEEILTIIGAVPKVGRLPAQNARSLQFVVGLLAATGMRLSEALGLQRKDFKGDLLFIRRSKFRKQRLIGLTKSTQVQVRRYLSEREPQLEDPHLILLSHDKRPSKPMVENNFRRITDHLGMTGRRGSGKPRLHDLRHTFAVRALETCGPDRQAIEAHLPALCAYLGHTSVRSTYHYLHLLPERQRKLGEFGPVGARS